MKFSPEQAAEYFAGTPAKVPDLRLAVPQMSERQRLDQQIEMLFGGPGERRVVDQSATARPSVPWNDQQDHAFKEVFKWLATPALRRNPVFRLFGWAGTGKTTMAREIAFNVESGEHGITRGSVVYAAYTGKAASVLRAKCCTGATTLHSLIYKPKIDQITGQIIGYDLNVESPLHTAALLIVDEVSMVDQEMAHDLLSFGAPILVLGDPDQLKPIKGTGYFTAVAADVMLTNIERQARDNPIIWLATQARQGLPIKPGRYGDSIVYRGRQISDEDLVGHDDVLVGMNKTRQALIRRHRRLSGHWYADSEFPQKGERLICLKNNKNNGLLNGTMWDCSEPEMRTIMRAVDPKNPKLGFEDTNIMGLHFKVRSRDQFDANGDPLIVNTVCSAHMFDRNLPEPPWRDIRGTDQFDFGVVKTVHKAQGSQENRVLVCDESGVFTDQQTNHLYTAITRAVTSVTLYQ